jgi:KaiC/GvpD/RAD55 family RecA-like ATPase
MENNKVKTGIDRLDHLLDGGIPMQSNVLAYASPFIGRDVLIHSFALTNLKEKWPVIFILTDNSFSDVRNEIKSLDDNFIKYEKKGLIRYIDGYSASIQGKEESPYVEFVDSHLDMSGLSKAINNAQKEIIKKSHKHCLILDSLSTLLAYSDAKAVFRFLQVLGGRCKRAGSTSMFSMESGMHSESEVQTMKHIMDGVIEFREINSGLSLRVQGCGNAVSRNWIDYVFEDNKIIITGALKVGRVA